MAAQLSLSLPLLFGLFLTLFFKTHLSLLIGEAEFVPGRFSNPAADVHELLPHYGLPKGLLPNNVKSYSLSAEGDFSIELESPCYVQFDRWVYFDKMIKGKLSYGAVHDASGIQAKKLFLWVSVTAIEVDKDSGMIEFFVGPLSEKLPAKEFEVVHACKAKAWHPETLVDSM